MRNTSPYGRNSYGLVSFPRSKMQNPPERPLRGKEGSTMSQATTERSNHQEHEHVESTRQLVTMALMCAVSRAALVRADPASCPPAPFLTYDPSLMSLPWCAASPSPPARASPSAPSRPSSTALILGEWVGAPHEHRRHAVLRRARPPPIYRRIPHTFAERPHRPGWSAALIAAVGAVAANLTIGVAVLVRHRRCHPAAASCAGSASRSTSDQDLC